MNAVSSIDPVCGSRAQASNGGDSGPQSCYSVSYTPMNIGYGDPSETACIPSSESPAGSSSSSVSVSSLHQHSSHAPHHSHPPPPHPAPHHHHPAHNDLIHDSSHNHAAMIQNDICWNAILTDADLEFSNPVNYSCQVVQHDTSSNSTCHCDECIVGNLMTNFIP